MPAYKSLKIAYDLALDEAARLVADAREGGGEPRRDDDPVHESPLGWHFDSEGVKRCDECGDEGHAGKHCPSVPDDYSADVHDANEHAPAGGGVGLP